MADPNYYLAQVRLLINILPLVAKQSDFALKGGTAINFFVRELPRLSVDIDLTYLPLADRAASLSGIHTNLKSLSDNIKAAFPAAAVKAKYLAGKTSGLFVADAGTQIA